MQQSKPDKSKVSRNNERKHQAAVTMAMFTALFLVCNLPCLLNNIMWFVNKILLYKTYSGPIYSHPFMAYYSWVISDVICTVVNAALNPVLYLSRMESYREWVSTKCSQRVQNGASSQRDAKPHKEKRWAYRTRDVKWTVTVCASMAHLYLKSAVNEFEGKTVMLGTTVK